MLVESTNACWGNRLGSKVTPPELGQSIRVVGACRMWMIFRLDDRVLSFMRREASQRLDNFNVEVFRVDRFFFVTFLLQVRCRYANTGQMFLRGSLVSRDQESFQDFARSSGRCCQYRPSCWPDFKILTYRTLQPAI